MAAIKNKKDWKYVYIISTKEWYEQILFVILCISFTAFIILLLLYFLMKLLSRKIYKPFNDVVDKAKSVLRMNLIPIMR